ncbi:LysR family transcriptional regulator [Pantoea sp. App145]|uniref:LysR family transcriptional regulator n=1 Tax=Pantoea sp. App145 TaxID=3071567 RepID=UPI003A804F5B
MAQINPRQLEAFYKVMKTGGVTEAAKIMNVTQPAVSRLIKDFEFSLNLQLFERDGRRLEPRQEASQLYREVERIFLGMEHVAQVADNIRQEKNRVLRLGVAPGLSQICADHVIPTLLTRYPGLSLVMDVESTASITEMVLSRQYDIGFISGNPGNTALRAEKVHQSHAVAVLSKSHPLADKTEIALSDLTDYRVLLPGRQTILRESLQKIISDNDIILSQILETSMKHCCDLAAAGLGVGIVDAITAQHMHETLVAVPFFPSIEVGYFAISPPKSGRSSLNTELQQIFIYEINKFHK